MNFLDLTDATDTEKREINEILFNCRSSALVQLPFDGNSIHKKPFRLKTLPDERLSGHMSDHPNDQPQHLMHQNDLHSVQCRAPDTGTCSAAPQCHVINSFEGSDVSYDPTPSPAANSKQQLLQPLPMQPMPYPSIMTHIPVMSSMASLIRPAVPGMDMRSGRTGSSGSSPNALVAGPAGMPFPFIGPVGPNGAGAPAFISGQPAVSAGQHPGPGYHVSGPNGQQQQMYQPQFIPHNVYFMPYPQPAFQPQQMNPHPQQQQQQQQRPQLMNENAAAQRSDCDQVHQPLFADREMTPHRAGSNHSQSSGSGHRQHNHRHRRHRHRKQSAPSSSSPSIPSTSRQPQANPHNHQPHQTDRQSPVTPSHVSSAGTTGSRQTRSSSSSSSHLIQPAASPPTSLSSCPCFSDEETAVTSDTRQRKQQPQQQQPQGVEHQSERQSGEAVVQQQEAAAKSASSPVPSASEETTKVAPIIINNNNKKDPSAVKSARPVNGHSSSAVPPVTSKPPSGPKSWSSLFKSSLPAAPAAPLRANSHTSAAKNNNNNNRSQMYDRVCLGGTFDSIHDGHMKLLNESMSHCTEMLTIGITDESMIRKKVLWELIAPVEQRIAAVRSYCEAYLKENSRPRLQLNIVPISDPFGPAITDATLKAIVVSDETIAGAAKINQIRQSNGMPLLHVVSIRLLPADNKECSLEDDKVSSSTLRMRKLGTLLKAPANSSSKLTNRPYLIGLTGGIASGKTSISNEFKKLGAGIIDCDKMAHLTYRPGSHVYEKIVREFGRDVVDERSSEIQRNKLGAKVFGNDAAKAKLESLVWPETSKLVFQEAERLRVQEKKEVVIVEAAQIIEAKWTDRLHQVWVTMIPEDVAVKRVMERNSLTEQQAKQRISCQMSNKERVSHANVVFSTFWDRDFTRAQVHKAWNMLHKRFLRAV